MKGEKGRIKPVDFIPPPEGSIAYVYQRLYCEAVERALLLIDPGDHLSAFRASPTFYHKTERVQMLKVSIRVTKYKDHEAHQKVWVNMEHSINPDGLTISISRDDYNHGPSEILRKRLESRLESVTLDECPSWKNYCELLSEIKKFRLPG